MMSVVPFNVMGSEENVYDKDARWWSTPVSYTHLDVYKRQVFGLDLLNIVGYGLVRTLNTKSSDHDLFDLVGRLLKRKVESSTVTHIDHQSLIAQIADLSLIHISTSTVPPDLSVGTGSSFG